MSEIFYKNANAKLSGVTGKGVGVFAAEAARQLLGGVWVQGTVVLTEEKLTFTANKLNRALQKGDMDFSFPLTLINGATVAGGFGMKTICVHMKGGDFEFRCFGAKSALAKLLSAVGEVRN
jgi:hypothetical protein